MQRQPTSDVQRWLRQTLVQRSQRIDTSFNLGNAGAADIFYVTNQGAGNGHSL